MIVQILLLLVGLALLVFGADWLVDGASSIARKAGISEFVIGLTIVGFGTSCPELVVSVTGAIQGNPDIAIGNVTGSNIFNTLLVLGLAALLSPMAISRQNRVRDIPLCLLATFIFIACGMSYTLFSLGHIDSISRVEGVVFLIVFVFYLYWTFKSDSGEDSSDEGEETKNISNIWFAILATVAGLAGLIFGGELFVNSAEKIARAAGVSDKFIAITLLAGGTSFPELVTCIVAIAKKKGQLALGNILGSNVFNLLLIVGVAAVIKPLSFGAMNLVDMFTMLGSIILVFLCSYTFGKNKIDRIEGAFMILCFAAYYIWLFMNN